MQTFRTWFIMMCSSLVFLCMAGCAGLEKSSANQTTVVNVPGNGPQPAVQSGPIYMDFPDVLIPSELKRSNSECYLSNGFGRLVLSGRVEGESLSKFFISAMPTTGWVYLQEYKYQGNIRIFFSKPDKIATILVAENPMDTKVEIWVTPLKAQ